MEELITQVYSKTGRMMAAPALRLLNQRACTPGRSVLQVSISIVADGRFGKLRSMDTSTG